MTIKMTAMRRGFITQARWINIDEPTNTVISIIDNNEREIFINNITDLLKFYTPLNGFHNLPSAYNMFNTFRFKEKIQKPKKHVQNDNEQRNMHDELMEGIQALNDEREGKKELKKHYVSDHSQTGNNTEQQFDYDEIVYELVIYKKDNTVHFVMEFECFDDLKYHLRSYLVRYPSVNSNFKVKTKYIKTTEIEIDLKDI